MSLPLVYHRDYVAPLPPGHRFPMSKFSDLRSLLINDCVAVSEQFHEPNPLPLEWLALVHEPAYIAAYCSGTLDAKVQRRIGLPWSPALANRTCIAASGSVLTAQLALKHGIACNTAGGTHHAFAGYGSGFCIFNDLAITARVLQAQNLVKTVLIVDLDVHQGDGTADIFKADSSVFTFSMHCAINFPGQKQHSDLDVPLPAGLEDDAYLQILSQYLPDLLSELKPDLVLYDAGVDPHSDDLLGKLSLTDTGLFRREMQVLSTCVGLGYPVACVIGGGYSKDMEALVYRHSLLHRAASEVYLQFRL